jgi:hypothetical protein
MGRTRCRVRQGAGVSAGAGPCGRRSFAYDLLGDTLTIVAVTDASPAEGSTLLGWHHPGLLFLVCSKIRLMSTKLNDNRRRDMAIECKLCGGPTNAGYGDQAAAWRPRLSRNPLAGRLLPDMQAERADGKPRHHATADHDQWPATPKPHRIFAHVVARRTFPVRRCRTGLGMK